MPILLINNLLPVRFGLTIFLFLCLCFQSAQAAGAKTSDIRVLVDVSGSMKQNDPRNLRRPAMDLLLQLFPDESRAGIWTFGRYVNMLVHHGVVNKKWRDQAEPQSRLVNSVALYTNIGLALEKANYDSNQKLFPSANNYKKSVILLTDGVVDIDADPAVNEAERQRILNEILPAYKKAGVTIHTVALSTNADVDLLEALSKETDGMFAVAEDANDLNKIFLRAFDQSSQGDRVPLEDNRFLIDSSVEEFTALVFKQANSDKTRLTNPAGEHFNASSASATLRWFESEEYDLITIKQPIEGEWKINAKFDPETRVTVVSNLSIDIEALANNIYLGDDLVLKLNMSDGGKRITDPAFFSILEVTANMSRDYAKFWQQQLTPATGTNVTYSRKLNMLSNTGNYGLTIMVDGKTFKREKKLTFSVREPFRVELAANEDQGEYTLSVFADNKILRSKNIDIKADIKLADGSKQQLTLDQSQLGHWSYKAENQLTGSYHIELNAKGIDTAGNAAEHFITSRKLYLNVPGVAEPMPLPIPEPVEEVIATEPIVEEKVVVEPIKEIVEPAPVETEEVKDEPETSRWMLYAALVAGNILLLGGLFFLYKKLIASPKNTEATAKEPEQKPAKETEEKAEEMVEGQSKEVENPASNIDEPESELVADDNLDEIKGQEVDLDMVSDEEVEASLIDVSKELEKNNDIVADEVEDDIDVEIDLSAILDDVLPSDEPIGDDLLDDAVEKNKAIENAVDEEQLLGDELLEDTVSEDQLLGDKLLDDTMLDIDEGESASSKDTITVPDTLDDDIDAVLAQFESNEDAPDEADNNFELDGEFDLSSDISDEVTKKTNTK